MARSDYYSGFARPAGVPWFAASGLLRADGVAIGISLQRSEKEGPFSGSEIERLNRALPRLKEVLSLAYRVNADRERSLLAGLELIDQAALLLDRFGRVRDMNMAAHHVNERLFTLREKQLVPIDEHARADFARWIEGACRPHADLHIAGRRVIRLEDRDGFIWLGQAMPVVGMAADVFGSGDTILIFSPAHGALRPSRALLATAFGLTSAESRVAEAVAAGLNTDMAARSLSLSRNAVRFHLKTIFSKARVRSQAEFVAAASALHRTRRRLID